MKYKLSEILNIYKPEELDEFLKEKSNTTLNEKNLVYDDVKKYWSFVGETEYNASTIDMLSNPGKGLIERITNGIDAVLEKAKDDYKIENPKSSEEIVKIAFPRYYENKCNILNGNSNRQNAVETENKVIVAINDSKKSNKPTIDVLDRGCGIKGENFINTILSIHKGNKSKTDKNYLIGAFGQGGSTSLPYSYATIIISKKDNKFYFTIVKQCVFEDLKMKSYLYFSPDANVAEVENDNVEHKDDYINDFIKQESGTFIRMIDMEIPKEYRMNDVVKPGMLGDFINTELYNVALPVKVIENRDNFVENKNSQNRISYGSFFKMFTWKYAKKDMFGTIRIEHNNREYKINYYVILPEDKSLWGKDGECKKIFSFFNVHLQPIIYTVNGQYIADESFTKLKNRGLSFLQYRLLVDINLDVLGKEKYDFFTSDRSKIKDSDLTKGFLDKVIDALVNEPTIKELNDEIANMSVSSNIDESLLKDISNSVKAYYSKYLKSGKVLSSGNGHKNTPTDEEIYYDEFQEFKITTSKQIFYSNEAVNIVVTTKAKKSVNDKANILMFIDGKQYNNFTPAYMNGRISYNVNGLKVGMHSIQFDLYDNGELKDRTDNFEFAVVDDIKEKTGKEQKSKDLNFDIKLVDDKELIADIITDDVNKKIIIQLCLTHQLLVDKIYGRTSSNDQIQGLKSKLIKPLVFYLLFNRENYDKIETSESKNEWILAFCNTINVSFFEKND